MVIGRAIYIPWGPDPPVIAYVSNGNIFFSDNF